MGRPIKNWCQIAAFTLMTVWLSSCSSYNNTVPIISLNTIANSKQMLLHVVNYDWQLISKNNFIVYKRNNTNIVNNIYYNMIYTVQRGDTLLYIACMSGNNFQNIAKINNISAPYNVYVGQKIKLTIFNNNGQLFSDKYKSNQLLFNSSINKINNINTDFSSHLYYSYNASKQNINLKLPSSLYRTKDKITNDLTILNNSNNSTIHHITPTINWCWITKGSIIDNFSSADGGNKGIDIAGVCGQPIVAAADGRVVYAGNALSGYGNLIIIKHNNDYLSAYAHNDTLVVREKQQVKAGQKIATMGSTGTTSVKLHFEIRYQGKSVNPLLYLPPR
ncbi:Murein hydrolase activator NlpD [Candidatus Profftia lariciata]|uniref:murein hydrolase activator NlpD n=1 Tax=Candidatus Profftia lariciata TaxID=1987921 RepID=UPI001D0161F9|nr:murein hydrolase activator NlpD [Candidatus Profftia lariciata]UDG81499.1 Murein hydrolase activator NlpD [Candidatus Profftia lariciata]